MVVPKIQIPQRRCHLAYQLHEAMKETHPSRESFLRYKEDIRYHLKMEGLDVYKSKDEQDITKWTNFVKKILKRHPTLDRYDNHWPIEQYVHIYHSNKKKEIPASTQIQNVSSDVEVLDNLTNHTESSGASDQTEHTNQISTSSNIEVIAVDTNQPKRRRQGPLDVMFQALYNRPVNLQSLSENVEAGPSRPNDASFANTVANEMLIQAPTQLPPPSIRIPSPASIEEQTPSTSALSTCRDLSVPIMVSCIQCDSSKVAEPLYNVRLRSFVKDEGLLGALATVGVRFDQHLDHLLRMKRSTLEMFFIDHVPAGKIDICMKWRLLRLFVNSSASTTVATTAGHNSTMETETNSDEYMVIEDEDECGYLMYIPPPTPEEEIVMINDPYMDFRANLQSAMRLNEDDVLFGDLLGAMVEKSCRYLSKPAPDEALLRKVIDMMSVTKPGQFEMYSNYWPIRVYLQWFQANAPLIRPEYTKDEEANILADVFSKKVLRALVNSPAWNPITVSNLQSQLQPKSLTRSLLSHKVAPTVEQLPCPISDFSGRSSQRGLHPPILIDLVCPAMKAYMLQQNLGELIPVLVHLGFYSEAHFTLLRQTMSSFCLTPSVLSTSSSFSLLPARADRKTVLDSPELSKVGDFQKFLLRIAFDIDEGVFHFV